MTTAAHITIQRTGHARLRNTPRIAARFAAAVAAALSALCSPGARAEAAGPEGWYAGVHFGAGHVSAWPARVDFGGVSVDGRLALGNGRRAGVLLGRHAGLWRFELQAQRGTLPVSQAQLGAVVQNLDTTGRYRALTVNALRVVPLAERWNLLAGVGLGMAEVKLPAIALANGCHCFAAASDRAVTAQARLGLEWQVAPAWRLQLAGGWLRLPGPTAATGSTSSHYERHGLLTVDAGVVGDF